MELLNYMRSEHFVPEVVVGEEQLAQILHTETGGRGIVALNIITDWGLSLLCQGKADGRLRSKCSVVED